MNKINLNELGWFTIHDIVSMMEVTPSRWERDKIRDSMAGHWLDKETVIFPDSEVRLFIERGKGDVFKKLPPHDLVTMKDACKSLGVSTMTLHRFGKAGKFEVVEANWKRNRPRWLMRASELERLRKK